MALMLTCSAASAVSQEPDTERFRVLADIHANPRSEEGRFALRGELRAMSVGSSPDGRFLLKAVHAPDVGCDPFTDSLFANGFEGP